MRNAIPIAGAVVLLSSSAVAEQKVRIATWNINNLWHEAGEALRPNAPIRAESDYELLRDYGGRLVADIVALQEMGNPEAAARIFPLSGTRRSSRNI